MRCFQDPHQVQSPHFKDKCDTTFMLKNFVTFELKADSSNIQKQRDEDSLKINKKILKRNSVQFIKKQDNCNSVQLPTFGNWKDLPQKRGSLKIHAKLQRKSLDLTVKFSDPNKQNIAQNSKYKPQSLMLKAYTKLKSKQFYKKQVIQKQALKHRPKLVSKAQKHQIYNSINKRDIQSHQRKRSIDIDSKPKRNQILSASTCRSLQKQCKNNNFKQLYLIHKQRYDKVVKRYGIENNHHDEFNQFLNHYA